VVNPQNDFANCLRVGELKKIWDRGSRVDNWREVRRGFPDLQMELFGAGTDSGTFDYFTEAVNGEEGRSRTDYNATEDDNVTVQGVSGSRGGIGYFGLSYAEQNQDRVKPVEIDGGDGCVAPTAETVQSGRYKPLSRPLFIYPSRRALRRPEVRAFVDFYLQNQEDITKQALFVSLTDEQLRRSRDRVARIAG
jgi:phosphate transport system substrate-binding protein